MNIPHFTRSRFFAFFILPVNTEYTNAEL